MEALLPRVIPAASANDGRYFCFAHVAFYGDGMIISAGKNDFANNTFDKYRWSANTYETPEEIIEYFDFLGLRKKKIKSISAIGAMLFYALGEIKERALDTLMDAGFITNYDTVEDYVSFSDGRKKTVAECKPLLDNVSLDRSVTLYEPLIITFEDGTALELLPWASKGLRIGYCTIPKGIIDGVNHCEFDIGILFNEYLSGRGFSSVKVISTKRRFTFNSPREDKDFSYNTYIFTFGNGSLRIEEKECSEYVVSFTHAGKIKCGVLSGIDPHPLNDSVILEASHRGGAMNIFPAAGTGWDESIIYTPCSEIISVCYSLPRLLDPLMRSCFDPDLPINRKCSEGHYDFYNWNFYTKQSILRMLDDVERQVSFIRTLPLYEQCEKLSFRTANRSDDELKERVEAELDYTQRFAVRLKGMALNTPDNNYISFQGP